MQQILPLRSCDDNTLNTNIRLCLILLAIFTELSFAENDGTPTYARISPWTIAIDRSMNSGCFLYAEFEGGNFLRIGKDNRDNSLYVFLGDPHWRRTEFGKQYPLEIRFGENEAWSVVATGTSFDPPNSQPVIGFAVSSEINVAAYFLYQFMKENHMEVSHKGRLIARINLHNSHSAVRKLIKCQSAIDLERRT